jgi:urea transport system substrate-binding protein
MEPTTSSCPPREKLADLQANALSAAEAEEIRRHIAGCPDCQRRLAGGDTRPHGSGDPGGSSADTSTFFKPRQAESQPPPAAEFAFLRPAVNPDELGRLGTYRVLRLIGKGGMGVVFEAEDIALNRLVALKVLRPDLTDAEYRERFVREAKAVASLPHDHIVTIYQVSEDNGAPFLAMEYLLGESLELRLQRDGWLPVAEALEITRQAAEGLAAAHAKGLVHRDVKPDNLWLESAADGSAGRVKLLDFGLARPAHGPSDLTAPGRIVGTPGYMAPEVVYGLQFDSRADLYGLGCVLYRMLTGKTPFAEEADTRAMLRAAATSGVPVVDPMDKNIPKPLLVLLRDLLARDPKDRPRDARAVIARLRDIERSEHVPPVGEGVPAPARDTKNRSSDGLRLGVWTGAVTVLLALCVLGYVVIQRSIIPYFPSPAGGTAPAADGEIAVGLLYSTSGSLAYSEKPVREATLQAIHEINDAGGVRGKRIKPLSANGGSDEETFEHGAEKLFQDGAVTLFGCWSSSSRKRVEAVCARHDRLLIYAVPDEGVEESPYVFYLGGTPNQLMIPAVRYLYTELRKRRFYLAGSDYVFSKVCHVILRHEVKVLGGVVVGEAYRPLGSVDFGDVAAELERSGADAVLCTVDSMSNVAFAQALRSREIRPPAVPTVWFNVGENELRYMNDAKKQMVNDYAPFCYFQSLDNPVNRAFLERFRTDSEDPTLAVSDPMEASYCSVYLWKQAVEAAGTTDTDELRSAFRQQSMIAPEGPIRIDAPTQRAWRIPRLGRINERLDFDIVWAAPEPVQPLPYPAFRSKKQWDALLQDLYKRWGGHWEEHSR